MKKTEIGVIVGRFQDEALHIGHTYLIDSVLRRHDRSLIILGVNPGMPTERNPMGFEPRFWMIKAQYPEMPVVFVEDCQSDEKWSQAVDAAIQREYGDGPAILYGSDREHSLGSYSGAHVCDIIPPLGEFSGTEARAKLEALPTSREFRRGLIVAARSRFPISFQTVDIALWKEFEDVPKILLGRKKGESAWRFPGGFVDPTDDSLEHAARRELREETMVDALSYECSPLVYVSSHRIDDWRYRSSKDKVMTALFITQFIHGSNPIANDDLEAVAFYSFVEATKVIAAEHMPLLRSLSEWMAKQKR